MKLNHDILQNPTNQAHQTFSYFRESEGDKEMEWFIWLYDRVKEYEKDGSGALPAHLAFKDWKPKIRV